MIQIVFDHGTVFNNSPSLQTVIEGFFFVFFLNPQRKTGFSASSHLLLNTKMHSNERKMVCLISCCPFVKAPRLWFSFDNHNSAFKIIFDQHFEIISLLLVFALNIAIQYSAIWSLESFEFMVFFVSEGLELHWQFS